MLREVIQKHLYYGTNASSILNTTVYGVLFFSIPMLGMVIVDLLRTESFSLWKFSYIAIVTLACGVSVGLVIWIAFIRPVRLRLGIEK